MNLEQRIAVLEHRQQRTERRVLGLIVGGLIVGGLFISMGARPKGVSSEEARRMGEESDRWRSLQLQEAALEVGSQPETPLYVTPTFQWPSAPLRVIVTTATPTAAKP